ncbi:phytanoyl-CoA dioxygenase family protein [Micromonospora yasonensis]|uniref:phytanoyl-CoA dioxygenase family protein n=1 Tax=Micromonospora yasonensis TaxID=1128667 RepID=UPI002230F3C8|nr:phytanoyl-CoA dioxygenase family protein [Micromonospora yasonensis]MCW3843573.1 phytanoyl-CoA dioxygenase family protein [Micromonospora yasonensis]
MTTLAPRSQTGTSPPDEIPDALIAQVKANGYGVLPDALTADEVAALNTEAAQICRAQLRLDRQPTHGLADIDVMRRFLCLHQPHKASAIFTAALAHPRLVAVLTKLIGPNVKSMQSMLFVKSAGKPGQAWHQDEFFIPTRDRSLYAAWIALDAATVDNGCLWVLPESHRTGVLYPDRDHADPRFDCTVEAYNFPFSDGEAVPVEVPAGAAVFFHGYLLHRSLPNTADCGFRRAFVGHYMSAESLLPWGPLPSDCHIGKHDFRDIVMVAGEDPYAWRGVEDVVGLHVRPDGDGGCDR